jgi:class 3 adenylate cyclase
MPNLKQLLNLKTKYSDTGSGFKKAEVKTLLEAFNPERLQKGFSFDDSVEEYREYFQKRKKVKAVLLFIDVTSFSQRFQTKPSDEIAAFLDEYYHKVIPIIIESGGEIEKIMGDGIICVFGEPFLSLTPVELHRKAERCAGKIIRSV